MRFTVSAGSFREAIAQVRSAIPTTPSLVAYSGVLMISAGDLVKFVGSDGETTLTATVGVRGAEAGQVLLQPRPLAAFLQTLGAGHSVAVSVDSNGDVQVCPDGLSPYMFRPLSATYPTPQGGGGVSRECDLRRLSQALASVRAAVSRETLAVQLVSTDTSLALHTTDTFRLARAVLPGAGFGEFRGVLPLPVLERAARAGTGTVRLDAKSRMLGFESDTVTVSSRLMATPFPAVESVVETQPPFSVSVDPQEVRLALARLLAVADQSAVRIRLEHSTMHLSVSTADIGAGAEEVQLAAPVAAPFEIMAKAQYLQDAVAGYESDRVLVSYSGPLQPLFFSAAEPFEVTQVVMPVRG